MFLSISANPPEICRLWIELSEVVNVTMPATRVDTSEAWLDSTVKDPIAPGNVTDVTSPSKRISSADMIFSVIVRFQLSIISKINYFTSARSLLPFSIASSIVPTFRKACSGYSSISPLRIILNPRMVSLKGTITPGSPVNCSATWKG